VTRGATAPGSGFTLLDDWQVGQASSADEVVETAHRLGRPLAIDADERCAFLGVPAAERARALASLDAPDFALPDLDGRAHRLSEQRGRKVLLVVYASW
jgi:hypothetical protein